MFIVTIQKDLCIVVLPTQALPSIYRALKIWRCSNYTLLIRSTTAFTLQLSRLQNDVLVGRKALPEKEKVERELERAQIELKGCEQRLRELEAAVENASDPQRLRVLPGDCPSRNEISSKIEQLEV